MFQTHNKKVKGIYSPHIKIGMCVTVTYEWTSDIKMHINNEVISKGISFFFKLQKEKSTSLLINLQGTGTGDISKTVSFTVILIFFRLFNNCY